jgi:mono/diheme cytochrome c family protein
MLLGLLLVAVLLGGCRNDMHDQPKYRPLRKSNFFSDSLSARPPVPGTVARGEYEEDRTYFTGLPEQSSASTVTMQPTGQQVVGTGETVPQGTARPNAEVQVTGQPGAGSAALPTATVPAGTSGVQGTGEGKFTATFPFAITKKVLLRGQERFNIYCSPCHGGTGDGKGLIVQRGFQTLPPSFHIDRLRKAPVGYFVDVISHGFGAMYSYASRVKPEDRWAIIAYIRALQRTQMGTTRDVPSEINLDAPVPAMNSHAGGGEGEHHPEGKK